MQEIEAIAKLLQAMGISSLFSPIIATVSIFYLMRKYVFSGVGVFLQTITTEYLKQNNERIQMETRIDIKLGDLGERLEKFVNQLMEWERRNSERITELKTELSDRIHNIEIVLSDKIFEEINTLNTNFEEHTEDFDSAMQKGQACAARNLAKMDTEEFRAKREHARAALM
jgi:hypothetical protein